MFNFNIVLLQFPDALVGYHEGAILIQEFAVRLIFVFTVGVSRHTKFSLSKARFSLIYFDNLLY